MTEKWNSRATNHSASRPNDPAESDLTPLSERFEATPVIVKLLNERGITTPQEARKFFSPSLNDLHDPFLMPGMDVAVGRLNDAMGAKERILVYGDYDVDGTTAVALVYKYLSQFYSQIDYYIPGRYDDGYGISKHVIDEAAASGVKLIIILDCGIKANDEIAYAKTLGIDFIICDHHVAGEELPDAIAILNPKLEGSTYPFSHLSGCGVGFKLMQAFARSNGLPQAPLDALLDLVAVSIAADIVPMIGENRVMTYHGLRRLNTNPNMGLRAIMKICGLTRKEITISDVIFKIGPRINASGRMQSGREAVDLLVSRDAADALRIAQEIDGYNSDRKELDKIITDEANAILEERGDLAAERKSIVIYNESWHRGIIGIVASRLTEDYYKPAVVLTLTNGLASGSSRSVQGFDIYAAVESCADLLENFGGHTYAVGLSMKPENIKEFSRRFEEYVAANITPSQMKPVCEIDADIKFSEISTDLVEALNAFNPFGPGNTKPVFRTRGVRDCGSSKIVGKQMEHIKLDVVDPSVSEPLNAIAFNFAKDFERVSSGQPFTLIYTIEENKHHAAGMPYQLLVKDIIFE
ncbi:MAG: single-stranded-DNA-specific exonuclease RecJ [Bacteroides sp.]|nr:single-stranded-DNA-specific exonuclease RecJ [Bacteroides sp.]MDE6032389.1 single-stranded-DNA-specific exonuclease RecJ [Muribaculaceae bacterium]MBD5352902.1 single-stranded-DNA-specific exonuclease RecJ [Bacteroides sp.]MBD5364628.1 single-stranded-DNA-specific exonuclease RecJ [Bacteroides sp.]MBD5373182.1 single-stranded-DNA-specific exonuclease RecJ [Bacteroides sp.]